MPIYEDSGDHIPFFWIGRKKMKIYIHDEGDGSYTFSSDILTAEKFSTRPESRTFIDNVKAWFETL